MDWISSLSSRWKAITGLNSTNSLWWLFDFSVVVKEVYNIQNSIPSFCALVGCHCAFLKLESFKNIMSFFLKIIAVIPSIFIPRYLNQLGWTFWVYCPILYPIIFSSFRVLSLPCCTASSCLHEENMLWTAFLGFQRCIIWIPVTRCDRKSTSLYSVRRTTGKKAVFNLAWRPCSRLEGWDIDVLPIV